MKVDEKVKLLSLHRYWIYSNRMKVLFEEELKNIITNKTHLNIDYRTEHSLYIGDYNLFRSYWYGSLFVVIEGYQNNFKISDKRIDDLMNLEYINNLRLFRNSTFHYQKEFYPEKASKVDNENEFIDWVKKLHSELGKFIIRELSSILPDNQMIEIQKTDV